MTATDAPPSGGSTRSSWIIAILGVVAALLTVLSAALGLYAGKAQQDISASNSDVGSLQAQVKQLTTANSQLKADNARLTTLLAGTDLPPRAADPSPSAKPGGSPLNSYDFTLPLEAGAPLGEAAPTPDDINAIDVERGQGDITWREIAGPGSGLGHGDGVRMVALPPGTTPSFQACKYNADMTIDQARDDPGVAVCIIEVAAGRIAAVQVKSVNLQKPASIRLHVDLWSNPS